MTHQASREAYAREHGLSAKVMSDRVQSHRVNASMHAFNARWNRLCNINATMYVPDGVFEVEPFGIRGVFLGTDDWHLSPEEAAAVEKAFQKRNKATIPVKLCPVNPCKEITFENCAENIARGYPVTVMPDGKVAMDIENCEHRDICPGPCKHCDDPVARSETVYKSGNIWHWTD